MEIVIQILMLFIFIGSVLKISFWKLWQTMLFGIVAALFIVATLPFAVMQSKTAIADYLQQTTVMQNIAVLISFESMIMFTFGFMALRELFGKRIRNKLMCLFRIFPGLLIFPVMFFLLTQAVFYFPGVNFNTIAYVMAGIVLFIFPTCALMFRKLIPEDEFRHETHFIVSLFIMIIGLITTVNGHVLYTPVQQPLNPKAIMLSITLFLTLFVAGYLTNKLKWRFRNKKTN
jgi:hypothetical protein